MTDNLKELYEEFINKLVNDETIKKDNQKLIEEKVAEQLPVLVEQKVRDAASRIRENISTETKDVADQALEGLKQKIEQDRMNTIQAASIVTIFIGFMVVQFNILQGDRSTMELAGLSFILLGSIIIFTLLLDLVIKLDLPYKKQKIIKGQLSTSTLFRAFSVMDRRVDIDLSWKPSTWGEGLIVRAAMAGIALVLMIIGAVLLAL